LDEEKHLYQEAPGYLKGGLCCSHLSSLAKKTPGRFYILQMQSVDPESKGQKKIIIIKY